MISYELAKKLKDAGFPIPDIRDGSHKQFLTPEIVIVPTLSELIEACGGVFFELSKLKDGWGCSDHYKIGRGLSPEEAVAILWLEQNKT